MRTGFGFCAIVALLTGVLGWVPGVAHGDSHNAVSVDRHVNYYYPPITSTEVYKARTSILAGSDRRRRVAFVTQLMAQMMGGSFDPGYVIFVKGERAQKMIITATNTEQYTNLFQLRALLALLTTRARGSELFRDAQVEDIFTYLDLLKVIGFERLTVTNGVDFTHQFSIE